MYFFIQRFGTLKVYLYLCGRRGGEIPCLFDAYAFTLNRRCLENN